MQIHRASGDVVLEIAPIREPVADLADRYALAPASSEKRRREFLTGRYLAEGALRGLGCANPFVPAHADRSPVWPEGFCGSISHTDQLCAVVVARRRAVRSVGLDIEPCGSLSAELVPYVCHPGDDAGPEDPTVIFCAKEAFYKAWYPVTRIMLDFADVRVAVTPEGRVEARVEARLEGRAAPSPDLAGMSGRLIRLGGHLLVAFALPDPHADPDSDPLGPDPLAVLSLLP